MGKWIQDESKNKTTLDGIDNLEEVTITIKRGNHENEIDLSSLIKSRFFEYLKLVVVLNKGFDCHAFVCFLANLKCTPEQPNFTYNEDTPEIGSIVALSIDSQLPESIQHWAIKINDNLYLSKFGQSGMGTQSHVAVMDFEGMCKLYKCNKIHHALPMENSDNWDGTFLRKNAV